MSFRRAQRMNFVAKSILRHIVDRAPKGSINLALGEPAFPTPQIIRAAAQAAIDLPRLGYTMNAGLVELRELVAQQRRRANANEVCITNGSQEALMAALLAMLDPGDRVLLPDPGFLAYPTCAHLAGAQCDFYQLRGEADFAFCADQFRAALTANTRLAIINSPANPTGQILAESDLKSIAAMLTGSDIWVLSDEIYADLYYDQPPLSIADYYENTIVIAGLSKSMSMTGWRLGWASGPVEAIEAITIIHQYLTTCAATLSQRAAMAAFGEAAAATAAGFRKELARRRDILATAAENDFKTDYVMPSGAFYLMLDVRRWGSSQAVAEQLLDYGVITVPGSAFGVNGEGYLRLSFSLPEAELREGIARLSNGLKNLS